jgi:hypothetical protein
VICLLSGVGGVAFQRKKAAAIGVKAPFPGFLEPALASSIEKVPSGERWIDPARDNSVDCSRPVAA